MQPTWRERVGCALLMLLVVLAGTGVAGGAIPGDANMDGCVDGADHAVVEDNFGTGHEWYQGDFNGDSTVDCVDVGLLFENWDIGGCGGAVPWPGFAECGLPRAGDANNDSHTEGADYTIWADNYLDTGIPTYLEGGWAEGNFNQDTVIDGADYTIWADAYEAPGSGDAPEPAATSLLGLASLALLRRRRR